MTSDQTASTPRKAQAFPGALLKVDAPSNVVQKTIQYKSSYAETATGITTSNSLTALLKPSLFGAHLQKQQALQTTCQLIVYMKSLHCEPLVTVTCAGSTYAALIKAAFSTSAGFRWQNHCNCRVALTSNGYEGIDGDRLGVFRQGG